MHKAFKSISFLLLFFSAAGLSAENVEPRETIAQIYRNIEQGGEPPLLEEMTNLLSPRLNALLAADAETGEEFSIPGRLDFDVFVSAQDWQLTEIDISQRFPDIGEGEGARLDQTRAIVKASFKNFGTPTLVHFYFEQDADGVWRIDDISSPDGWVLSLLLKYGKWVGAADVSSSEPARTGEDYAALSEAVDAMFARFPAEPGPAHPVDTAMISELSELTGRSFDIDPEPNFAGRYTIASMACGTECQSYVVVNATENKDAPATTSRYGADWRANSRLLITSPPVELASFGDGAVPSFLEPKCYLLNDQEAFELIDCEF